MRKSKPAFRINTFRLLFTISFVFLIVLISSLFYIDKSALASNDRYKQLQLFTKVLNLIEQYYVEEIDSKKLIYGGIKGMLRELDPHTNFLPKKIFKEFETETSGEFGGLGIEITLRKGILTVISPIEDTPAWKAGIESGDKIVSINGESTKGLSLVEAAQLMRGKMGSVVKLGIFRKNFQKPKVYPVKRDVVKVKSVKYTDLKEGYAYIKITSFYETTFSELKSNLKKHKKRHKAVRGLIIDLRRNPGGLLDQAVKISDLFLNKGVIVSTVNRNKTDKETIYATVDNTENNYPVIVLINEYSASASEIVAGALQDNKRALIMGKRSFGKGSVQSVIKLGDGSGLKLTIARYYTPSGRSIQALGVKPDVDIDPLSSEIIAEALANRSIRREKDIKGHLRGDAERKQLRKAKKELSAFELFWGSDEKNKKRMSRGEKLLKNDFQVLQAYNYMKAWKVMKHF